ncbi:hypothetical protein Q8A73_002806 [Channa argus]|nr:hypothetical protein Q8A73_002806 [Channa argus]
MLISELIPAEWRKYLHQPCTLKNFRQLMVISFVITILLLIYLIWLYRPDNYSPAFEPPIREQSPPPQQCGPRPNGQQVSLVAVNETKTILASAYQEHRKGKKESSETTQPETRTAAL